MYVERAYAVGKRLHDINVSTQRLIEAFRPLIEQRAGDLDHEALLKQVHKHGIVMHQIPASNVSLLSVPLQNGEARPFHRLRRLRRLLSREVHAAKPAVRFDHIRAQSRALAALRGCAHHPDQEGRLHPRRYSDIHHR